jgi:hypothetical protein
MTFSAPILVVSGLPRSGTSLVMQMLKAGGAPLLVDELRPADAHNPQGYFEFEPVKRLRFNHEWLPQATGKAIKIVSPLLEYLPTGFEYRVVFVERELAEVVASQRAMLARNGRQGSTLGEAELIAVYKRQQAVIANVLVTRRDFTVLRIEHRQILVDPAGEVRRLAQFALPFWPNILLDQAAMAAVVDPSLYRQRSGS